MRFFEYINSINDFYKNNGIQIDPLPEVILNRKTNDSLDPFIRTGFFDCTKNTIELYISNRQLKDILRTYCHELIHVNQFLNDRDGFMKARSAKRLSDDVELTKLESDAYLRGNVLFRQWTETFTK